MWEKQKKKRRSQKAKGESKSFVKIEVRQRLQEARRNSKVGFACSCADPTSCQHGNTIWLTRAEKLPKIRGNMNVELWRLPPEKFWLAVDGLSPAPRATKPPAVKTSAGVSLKSSIETLKQKAKKKSAGGKCDCAPWTECNHLSADEQAMWRQRFEKMATLSIEDAAPLLPHLGTSDVWEAVDLLEAKTATPVVDHSDAVLLKHKTAVPVPDDWATVDQKPNSATSMVDRPKRPRFKMPAHTPPRLGDPDFEW